MRFPAKALIDESTEETRKWYDVILNASLFKSRHILSALADRDNGPWIPTRSQHHVHQEAPHASVAVHVGVNVDKEKVSKNNSHGGLLLFAEHIEKNRKRIAHGIRVHRYVH
jgi:hypothetical protein